MRLIETRPAVFDIFLIPPDFLAFPPKEFTALPGRALPVAVSEEHGFHTSCDLGYHLAGCSPFVLR